MASNLHSMQTTSQRKPVQTGAFQIPQVEHHYLSDMSMLAYCIPAIYILDYLVVAYRCIYIPKHYYLYTFSKVII